MMDKIVRITVSILKISSVLMTKRRIMPNVIIKLRRKNRINKFNIKNNSKNKGTQKTII